VHIVSLNYMEVAMEQPCMTWFE